MGAKNAVLPIMVATVLAPGHYELGNIPGIVDVRLMMEVLGHFGIECDFHQHTLLIDVPDEIRPEAPIELVRRMRASVRSLSS